MNNLTLPQELIYFSRVKVRLIMGVCKYELCKDWAHDGCGWPGVHDFTGSIRKLGANGNPAWGCGGGCCNGTSSYSTRGSGCTDTELIAYEKPYYWGHSQVMRGHNQRVDREGKPGCRDDWWGSIRKRDIPRSRQGKLARLDTDKDCSGLTRNNSYKKVAGKKSACFYSSSDEREVRALLSAGNTADHGTMKNKFCQISENVFKNPGGGLCLEYDTSKTLAKAFCSVGNRIATEASCTQLNLGNFYDSVAEAYCKTADGQADPWCSCYNVSNNVCDSNTAAAGCAEKRQTYDKLVEATPDDYKNSWSDMEPCFGKVCRGDKYLPEGYDTNCSRPVQVCVQDFDFQTIADSPINATCNLSTDDGPSAGGGSDGGGSDGGGSSDSNSFLDLNNTTTQLAMGGGVGTLFMSCCCLLIIILLATSGGGGPTRFRRR